MFLRVCQPSPFLLFGVEHLHSELQCDGHAGLSSNSSLTMTLSRSLVHCCHRAGSKLDPPQEWWVAAVPVQEALPLPLAILLLLMASPKAALSPRWAPSRSGCCAPSSRPVEHLWSGRAIWRMLHPRLVSLTHTWLLCS